MWLLSCLISWNRSSRWAKVLFLLTAFDTCMSSSSQAQLLDDRAITITSISDADMRRQQLISYIWGTDGFPAATKLPARTSLSINALPSDLTPTGVPLANLEQVDKLTISMEGPVGEPPETNIAYHLIPKRKNNRLVIMNPGHACGYVDHFGDPYSDTGYGDLRTLNALLREGYSVLATYMPHFQPGACVLNHNALMAKPVRTGSPLKWFMEPIAVSLNYLRSQYVVDGFPQYQDYNFVGLSGGGWTGVVYAALDPSIKVTIPVSGSIPLYLRSGGSVGDDEQKISSFYSIAGYPDLYILGSLGAGRRHIQILNRRDNCCFGERDHAGLLPWQTAMRSTERDVRTALYNLGTTSAAGSFRLEIDDAADGHKISWYSIANMITAELNDAGRPVAVVSTNKPFVRGLNGNLWQHTSTGWIDTNLPMVGVPVVIENAIRSVDVFYRDPGNFLMHAYQTGSTWVTTPMGGQIGVDPVVGRAGTNSLFVAGVGYDYHLYYWSLQANGTFGAYRAVSNSFRALGQPAIVATPTAVYLYARSFDGKLYRLASNSSVSPTSWAKELVGGDVADLPSAIQTGNTSKVYVRGANTNHLWEASKSGTRPWVWTDVSVATGAPALTGSPSVSLTGSTIHVAARDTSGNLVRFTKNVSWSVSAVPAFLVGAPVTVGSQVFVRGSSGQIWRFDGTDWVSLGGLTNQ